MPTKVQHLVFTRASELALWDCFSGLQIQMAQWLDVSPVSDLLLLSLNFTWFVELSPLFPRSGNHPLLFITSQAKTNTLMWSCSFSQNPSRPNVGKKKPHRHSGVNWKPAGWQAHHSAVGIEAAFGPLDDWGHSRDVVKWPFSLVLEPSAIKASSGRKWRESRNSAWI